MKKYKLIKEYPGCRAKLNEIVETPVNWKHSYNIFDIPTAPRFKCGIKPEEVENNPEFWQEVVELNYEILSFKGNSGAILSQYSNDGYGENSGVFSLKDCLDLGVKIHSIKRLSDNEVFSVGDRVTPAYNQHKEVKTISKIEFYDSYYKDNIKISLTDGYDGVSPMCNIKHAKKPLFVTEDGVGLYIGDDYCSASIDGSFNNFELHSLDERSDQCQAKSNGYLWFSTAEKARTFVDENKPKYSEKDMLDFGLTVDYSITPIRNPENVIKGIFKTWKGKNGKN